MEFNLTCGLWFPSRMRNSNSTVLAFSTGFSIYPCPDRLSVGEKKGRDLSDQRPVP
jgi:hypothetical protein